MKTVITIGRQYGSGGRIIGHKLAEALNIPFYDKDLITLSAKESGLHEDVLSTVDEVPANGFMYNLVSGIGSRVMSPVEIPLNDKLFILLSQTIKKLAHESCVIVGRSGNYILRDNPNVLRVFVYADLEDRIKKVCRTENVDENRARDLIKKTDRRRASYSNYYTDLKWGHPEGYDLMLNSSEFGYEKAVQLIEKAIEMKEQSET